MAQWQHHSLRFENRGLDLIHPVDDVDKGYYSRLTNLESKQEGTLTPRPGYIIGNVTAMSGQITSISRLEDPANSATGAHIVGTDAGNLYSRSTGAVAADLFTLREANFSANPFSLVPWRPRKTRSAWMYVGDSKKMRKLDRATSDFQVGIAPPSAEIVPPTVAAATATVIHALDVSTGWTITNPTGGTLTLTAPAASPNINVQKQTRDARPGAVAAVVQASMDTVDKVYSFSRAVTPNLEAGFDHKSRIEIFMRPDDPRNLSEIHLIVNVDSDATNFTRNYYLKAIRASDLEKAVEADQTLIDALKDRFDRRLLEQEVRRGGRFDMPIWSEIAWERQADDEFDPITLLSLGRNVWSAISIKKSEFQRVGTDETRDWSTVSGIMIRIITAAKFSGAASTLVVQFFEWDMAGVGGMDSTIGSKYDWRYTYWNNPEGIESNPSPEMTSTFEVVKRPVTLSITASGDAQVTHIRIYRRGGSLLSFWYMVDQVANTTGTFIDNKDDLSIAGNPLLDLDNDEPVTSISTRTNLLVRSEEFDSASWTKTTSSITANDAEDINENLLADRLVSSAINGSVTQSITIASNGTFTLSLWMKRRLGTGAVEINAGGGWTAVSVETAATADLVTNWARYSLSQALTTTGNPHTVGVRLAVSTDEVWLWGAQFEQQSYVTPYIKTTSATESVTDGNLRAAPLEVIFGPYLGKWMFGIGDFDTGTARVINPDRLWWCKAGYADAWPPENWLSITSFSDPLLNGFIYNGKAYVFSSERLYVVIPSLTGGSTFTVLDTSCGVGLWKKWCFTIGPKIWFLGKEGIYETEGGEARNITDTSFIRPLFKEQAVNGYNAVDMAATVSANKVRLQYKDPYLYFFYVDTAAANKILRYHTLFERWEFWESSVISPVMGYWEHQARNFLIGDTTGRLFTELNTQYFDDRPADGVDTAIAWKVRTGALDEDLGRIEKIYGDIFIEYDPKGAGTASDTITVTPYIDDEAAAEATTTLGTTAGRQRQIIPLRKGSGVQGRSLSLEFSGGAVSAAPVLYEADISFIPRGDEVATRGTDWEDLGVPFEKYVWGCSIDCDTFEKAKTIHIQGDGTTQSIVTIAVPINTTVTSIAASTVTPASMVNIHQGLKLLINSVEKSVTTITATTFDVDNATGIAAAQAITLQVGENLRRRVELSFTNFKAKQLRIISEDTDPWLIYGEINWYFDADKQRIEKFDSNWDDLGWPYEKLIKGISMEVDTGGTQKQFILRINGADGTNTATFNVTTSGRTKIVEDFDNINAKTVKIVSTDAVLSRIYKLNWIWDREPPAMDTWQTQEVSFNQTSYFFLREAFIAVRSTADVTLALSIDGTSTNYTLASTSGNRRKVRVLFKPAKGKTFKMKFTSTAVFQLYNEDSMVWVRGYGAEQEQNYKLVFEGYSEGNP